MRNLKNVLWILLFLCLIGLGTVTLMTANKMISLQSDMKELQQEIRNLSDRISAVESNDLSSGQQEVPLADAEEASVSPVPSPEPTAVPAEEGTLSPTTGTETPFADASDSSLDALMGQVTGLLPSSNGNWAVYVANLASGGESSINNTRMQAASLIKLFIMGAVYENYSSLTSSYGTEAVNANLHSMITVSDNDAANTLTTWLGNGDSTSGRIVVNQFCLSHGYTSTSMGRMLLQSNADGDNYTSVNDCGRFLREIYQSVQGNTSGTLSNCTAMLSLLSEQQRRNKIPAQIPAGVTVANKTGELSNVENDAAILYHTAKNIDLVIVFMSENLNDSGSAQSSIASISRMIYGYYNE